MMFDREVLDVPPKCQNSLVKAVGDGNIRTLRHLLEKGFDVNSSSSQDSTTVSSHHQCMAGALYLSIALNCNMISSYVLAWTCV